MRTILLNIVIMFFSFLVAGQDTLQTRNNNTIVKVDLVASAVGLLNFRYRNVYSASIEHSMFENQSFQITALYGENFIDKDYSLGTSLNPYNYHIKKLRKTIQFFVQYRFYPTKRKKLYIGHYLTYAFSHEYEENTYYTDNLELEWDFKQHDAGIGGVMGFQFFIKKRISVDFSLGLARVVAVNARFYKPPLATDGIVALNIGYRFIHK